MVKEMNTFFPKTMFCVRVFLSAFFVASQLLNIVAHGQTVNRDRKDNHSQNYAQVSDKEQKQLFGLWILTFKPAFKVKTMLGDNEQTISITIDVRHGQAVSGRANWNYTSPHDGLETVSALVEGTISEEQKIHLAIISPILRQQGQDAKYLTLDGHFVSSGEITGQVFPGSLEQKKTYLRVPLPQGGSFKLSRTDATALVTSPAANEANPETIPNCPKCGKSLNVVPIVNGRPAPKLYKAFQAGRVWLGSCSAADTENWRCKTCKQNFVGVQPDWSKYN